MKIKLPILFLLIFSFAHAEVPPNWNQSIPYSSSALVLDSNGVTYIAQQDVPAGTPLTDTSYWLDLDTDVPNLEPGAAPTSTPDTSTVPTETPDTSTPTPVAVQYGVSAGLLWSINW